MNLCNQTTINARNRKDFLQWVDRTVHGRLSDAEDHSNHWKSMSSQFNDFRLTTKHNRSQFMPLHLETLSESWAQMQNVLCRCFHFCVPLPSVVPERSNISVAASGKPKGFSTERSLPTGEYDALLSNKTLMAMLYGRFTEDFGAFGYTTTSFQPLRDPKVTAMVDNGECPYGRSELGTVREVQWSPAPVLSRPHQGPQTQNVTGLPAI